MESKTAVASLAALAQDARLAIFRLLVQKGPEGLCVGDIAAKFGMAPATLSFHLKELTSAGLLVARQEGRFIYYALPSGALQDDGVGRDTEHLDLGCCRLEIPKPSEPEA